MKRATIYLLQFYKHWLSPAFPPSCRYVPTCSEYALEAVDRYGVFRGMAMTGWRLLRCHPLARGGYDPVARRHANRDAVRQQLIQPEEVQPEMARQRLDRNSSYSHQCHI